MKVYPSSILQRNLRSSNKGDDSLFSPLRKARISSAMVIVRSFPPVHLTAMVTGKILPLTSKISTICLTKSSNAFKKLPNLWQERIGGYCREAMEAVWLPAKAGDPSPLGRVPWNSNPKATKRSNN
jgi:hypothetical protein